MKLWYTWFAYLPPPPSRWSSTFVSLVSSDVKKADSVINEFNISKKIIRKKIVDKVKLKYAPEISFFFDETINEVKRLDELFSSEKVQNDTIS